jgi:mannose-6-phosphate isomerase-like protein (cupin superfamily)
VFPASSQYRDSVKGSRSRVDSLLETEQTMSDFEALELQGSERHKALAEIHKQISEWRLTMPAVTPLPLHFGLHRFKQTGETEFWIANETRHGYCGKFLFVFDGQTCPYHHHRKKHETFFVMKGTLKLNIAGKESLLHEGQSLAIPPGTGHSFTGVGPALLLEVSMPSILHDNFFDDTQIGDGGVI